MSHRVMCGTFLQILHIDALVSKSGEQGTLQRTCILFQRSVQLGQAGLQIALGCIGPHRSQLHVVSCLDALAMALWNIVQLTLILVMIQCNDLQTDPKQADANVAFDRK